MGYGRVSFDPCWTIIGSPPPKCYGINCHKMPWTLDQMAVGEEESDTFLQKSYHWL